MCLGREMKKTRRWHCHGHPKANEVEGDQEKHGDGQQRGRGICLDGQVGGQQKTLPETDQGGEICASPYAPRGAKRIGKVRKQISIIHQSAENH